MLLQELVTRLGFETDERPLHRIEHTLEGVGKKLEFLAAVEIVKGIYELAERFAGMGESLETAAISAGITTEAFQKLAFAASQNAVGQDALSGALARMQRILANAKDGSKQATASFARLGITPAQIASFHNSEDALYAVEDAVKSIQDPIKRVQAVQAIFGRGSANMIKFLSKGSDETRRLGKEAMTMGAVLDDQGVESLANFEDAVSGLMQVIRTFAARIGATFAPVFVEVIHDIEQLWGANQKLIQQNLKKWAQDAAFAFGFVTEIIRIAVVAIVDFIKQHPELVQNVAKVVAGLIVLSLTVGTLKFLLGGLVDSYKAVMGVASLARPVLGAAFSLGVTAGRLLLGTLGMLMERLGLLVVSYFPKLGEAIFAFGSKLTLLAANPMVLTILGIAAAVGAVVLAIQAAWAMLHGKSFWDTWIGEGLNAILKYGGKAWSYVKGIFGGGPDSRNTVGPMGDMGSPQDLQEAVAANSRRLNAGATDEGSTPGVNAFLAAVSKMSGLSAMGTGSLAALNATAMPLSDMPTPGMMPQAASQTVTVNAPITINASGGDARDIAREAHKAVHSVINQTLRATQRDTQPVASH